MPDWPCLEDECEFEKDPVKVIGLYSLLLLDKSLLHAPLSFKHAVATFKKKKFAALVHVVRYFHGLGTVCKHGPSLPLCPLPKRRKHTPIKLDTSEEKQNEQNLRQVLVRGSLGWGFFPYADVADL